MTQEKTLEIMADAIKALQKTVEVQKGQIQALTDNLYGIAPALGYIELTAETPEEKHKMLEHYAVNNVDWDFDRKNYSPDKIIAEMAAATTDETALECLKAMHEDYGSGYIVRLYKKWKGVDPDINVLRNLGIIQDTEKG